MSQNGKIRLLVALASVCALASAVVLLRKGKGLAAPANASSEKADVLRMPFLGLVNITSKEVAVPIPAGPSPITWQLRVFHDSEGRPVRWEYHKANETSYASTPAELEAVYESSGDVIHAFGKNPAKIDFPDLLQRIGTLVDPQKVTHLDVTFAHWNTTGAGLDLPQDVFIANVFGARTIGRSEDIPQNRRVRFIFDARGDLLMTDNLL